MNVQIISIIGVIFVTICWGDYVPPVPRPSVCNDGQRYWCQNITTAAECSAVKHCIQGVWEHEVPIQADKTSVCQTCLEMVKLARDQLESNETQDELRQVLEAPCKIVPTKVLRSDCVKLMDDYGSYVVDTLASQMNPQVVCSVVGLCYSNRFVEHKDISVNKVELTCDNCYSLMDQVKGNIETATTNDIFTVLAGICGNMGSFSDACSSIIHDNLEKVDALIRSNVKASPVCSLAGVCKERYHSHADSKLIRVPVGDVEIIGRQKNDDLPCDLCVQLVQHLRDVLIANTTEEEFKEVVMGLCKMSPLKDECETIVNDYYPQIYTFLVEELNGTILCAQIGICPKGGLTVVRPLIMVDDAAKAQLPVERMFPHTAITFVNYSILKNTKPNPELCSFCEYFLHFLQQELTLPSSEKEITDVVKKACHKLPVTVVSECDSFVDTYMATFVALLANRIDPSQVCPNLGVCQSALVAVEYKDKPTCPLCLLAVEAILAKISNRTEMEIDDAFDDLCMRDVFPNTLSTECVTFVTYYRDQLTDMIIAEFSSQEACVYANLCAVPRQSTTPSFIKDEHKIESHHELEEEEHKIISSGNVETNEIMQTVSKPNLCVLCEFIMSKLEEELKDKKTEEEIKEAVYKICSHLPKTVAPQCKTFVEQYADFVLDLLSQEIDPKEICTYLNLCNKGVHLIKSPIKRCLMCELLMDGLKTVMTEPEVEDDLNVQLLKACNVFPEDHINICRRMVEVMAPQIETALRTLPVGPLVCHRVHMCISVSRPQLVKLAGAKGKCYLGPDFWCKTTITAARCQQIEYCQKHVWRSDKPQKSIKKGSVIY
uniref:Pulmonary surfactant-associated protein B n=1 Tax=Pristhesancus plagipennis TaxID=1955184 RepID=A0A2K8JWI7_PRIPG|nr:secreted Prosaposin protein [Pristhesancus plagipennis]